MDSLSHNVTILMDGLSYQLNSTNQTSDMPPEPPLYIVLTSTLLYSLIFVVGILGNILVVVVILLSRSMKTTVNMYLMNLCVADVLVIIVCMPTALADIFTKEVWYFGRWMCKLVPFLENAVAHASVLTILAINIERYRVVCYPLKVVNKATIKVWMIVAVIWIVSASFSLPWLSIPTVKKSEFLDGTPIQVCRIPITRVWQEVFIVTLAVLFFLLPCLLMFVLNCHLCRVLNKTSEYDPCIHEGRNDRRKRQTQVTNIIASIVIVFFMCHLPFRVAGLWLSFGDHDTIASLGLERYLGIVYSTRILFYLNHALNPVVYSFVSTKFRCALNELFSNTICSKFCSTLTQSNRKLSNISATTRLTPRMNTNIRGQQNSSPGTGKHSSDCADKLLDQEYKLKINFEDKRVAIKFNFISKSECA